MYVVNFTVEQVVDQHHLDTIVDQINKYAYVAGIEVVRSRIEGGSNDHR